MRMILNLSGLFERHRRTFRAVKRRMALLNPAADAFRQMRDHLYPRSA